MALRELDLSGNQRISDIGVRHLTVLTSLTRLVLSGCNEISDVGVQHLTAWTCLTRLVFFGCDKITAPGASCIEKFRNLSLLNLRFRNKLMYGILCHLRLLMPFGDVF